MKKSFMLWVLLFVCARIAFAQSFSANGINYNVLDETFKTVGVTSGGSYSGDVTIPETVEYNNESYTVTQIGYDAFYGCSALTSVILPNTLTLIDDYAFGRCSSLTSITIPRDFTTIDGSNVFYGCSSLTSIVWNAKNYTGDYPFNRIASQITSFTFGDAVETINGGLCSGMAITSINIPASVISILGNPFSGCTNLASITVDAGNTLYVSVDNCLLTRRTHQLVSGCKTSVIPTDANVAATIGESAFAGTGITEITIPSNIVSFGSYAFRDCANLEKVNYMGTMDTWAAISFNSYANPLWNGADFYINDVKVTELTLTTTPGTSFRGCTSLQRVTLTESVDYIDSHAFDGCSNLQSITIPDAVRYIDYNTFYNCTNLQSVTLPSNLYGISYYAFYGCSSLKSITIPSTVTSISNNVFSDSLAIVMKGSTPPSLDSDAFALKSSIIVPCGSSNAYWSNAEWAKYPNFSETPAIDWKAVSESDLKGTVKVTKYPTCDNAEATFEAQPATGYQFAAWNDGNTTNPRTVSITEAVTYTASFTATGTVAIPVSGVTLDLTQLILFTSETCQLSATVLPAEASDKNLTWSSNNSAVATVTQAGLVEAVGNGTAIITVTTADGGYTAQCTVNVITLSTDPTAYVDLGLPSGTLWATCNIGASSPAESGEHFAWGETSTKSSYSWSTYIHGGEYSLTKYCIDATYGTVDNLIQLTSADDAATVNWGKHWRTPTSTELQELCDNCTWTWTTYNGVNGYLVVSTNGNAIFLPAAGVRDGSILNNAGSYSYYLSSSLNTSNTQCTWGLGFNSSRHYTSNKGNRYTGQSVRAVYTLHLVESVSLNHTSLLMAVNTTNTLTATVLPDNASHKDVRWYSDNTSVATVSSSGVVTAVGEGTAIITVTTADGGYTAQCTVTVILPGSITYDLNGGVTNEYGWTCPQDMYNTLIADIVAYNSILSNIDWAKLDSTNFNPFATGVGTPFGCGYQKIETDFLSSSDFQTHFGWLDSYLTSTCSTTGYTDIRESGSALRGNITAFFFNTVYTSWPNTPDYSTCGVSNYASYASHWKGAYANPTNPTSSFVLHAPYKEGAIFAGWYAAADFSGEPITTVDGTFNGTLYAKWEIPPVPVTNVVLDKTSLGLTVGATEQLTATVYPSDAANPNISWHSNKTYVATVQDGQITAVGAGTATITVTTEDGNKTATCTVTVTAVSTTDPSVVLDKTSVELLVGSTVQLTAKVYPETGTTPSLIWISSNTDVVSVTQTGALTALAAGTSMITVVTEDGSYSAQCQVTVQELVIPVTGITLDKSVLNMFAGESSQLSATVLPASATNKQVRWSTNDSSVASVDNGLVTARSAGTTTITAQSAEGYYWASCVVTVTVPVTSVSLNQYSLNLNIGEYSQLTATVFPTDANTQSVTWSTNDASVATVRDGLVTAVGAGSTEIVVTTVEGKKTATCTVTVTDPAVHVTSVVLNASSLALTVNNTTQLTATVYPSNATNKNVGWSTNDASVATVQDGWVTAVGVGTTYIVVTTEDGQQSASCEVTVTSPNSSDPVISVTGVSLSQSSLNLNIGTTEQLYATISPSNASNQSVTWSTNDASVATVRDGLVTAVGAGSTTIVVTTADGQYTARCSVTVVDPTVHVTSILLDKTSLSLTVGATEQLTATLYPSNATNKNVVWSSDNPSVAVVQDGQVSALGAGSTIIRVTSEDGQRTATCRVTVTAINTNEPSIVLSATSVALIVGGSTQLTATVYPAATIAPSTIWSSSNPTVASVSDGRVTALAKGTAIIIATTADGKYSATCSVTVEEQVSLTTEIILDETELQLYVGSEKQLTATVLPADAANATILWQSDNTDVVTVVNGLVKAHAKGTATIKATTSDGSIEARCNVTVIIPVSGIEISDKSLTLSVGASQKLSASVLPYSAKNQNYTWSTSNSSVVTIDTNGLVKAVGAGTATITAKSDEGGYTATCVVTVVSPVTGVTLNKTTLELVEGSTERLIATVSPSNAGNKKVTYTTSNKRVATVDDTGKVTALSAGTTTITVVTEEGKYKAKCQVTVVAKTIAVSSISLDATELTLFVGDGQQLTATVLPDDATNTTVLWNTSNAKVATVEDGYIRAISRGSVTITATTEDGRKQATCAVTVKDDTGIDNVDAESGDDIHKIYEGNIIYIIRNGEKYTLDGQLVK